jgi:hypothetical protein
MLAKLKTYGPVINLVPHTGVQFLDFGFDINALRISRAFLNEPDGADGEPRLICLYRNSDGGPLVDANGRVPVQQERIYSLTGARAADTFLDTWLPLPCFRIRETQPDGCHVFDEGPTNWARVRLVALEKPDADGNTHRLSPCIRDAGTAENDDGRMNTIFCLQQIRLEKLQLQTHRAQFIPEQKFPVGVRQAIGMRACLGGLRHLFGCTGIVLCSTENRFQHLRF